MSFKAMTQAVSETYRIPEHILTGKSRQRSIARPRQVLMACARECLGWSYPRIGMSLKRDHTTIINGCRRYAENPCNRTADVLRRYMALVNHERAA